MQQRYYDPVIGRFYSNDPVGFTASNPMMFNRYAYANNNPYKFVDPDGREPFNFPWITQAQNPTRAVFSESQAEKFNETATNVGEAMLAAGELTITVTGNIPGPIGLTVTLVDGVGDLATSGDTSGLAGATAGELVGKGIESNLDTSKLGKLGVIAQIGIQAIKFGTAQLTEQHVKEHQSEAVKKDETTEHQNDKKE